MRAKAVVFDFDGVIADSMPAQQEAWQQACRQEAPALAATALRRLLKNFWAGRSGAGIFEGLDLPEETQRALRTTKDEIWEQQRAAVTPVEGVIEAIRKLRTLCPLSIATTSVRPHVESFLTRYGIQNEFESLITSADVANPKPAPDALLLLSRQLALPPGALIVVGDTATDFEMAMSAGSQLVLLRTHDGAGDFPDGTPIYSSWTGILQELLDRLSLRQGGTDED
jgi:AHBA synthesis associated protein